MSGVSLQTRWEVASRDEPAKFALDYATIKVQAIRNDENGELHVRIAHSFDVDAEQGRFEQWYQEAILDDEDLLSACKESYQLLKRLSAQTAGNDSNLLQKICRILERDPGLIRA